jgi:hypothetical protein
MDLSGTSRITTSIAFTEIMTLPALPGCPEVAQPLATPAGNQMFS